MIQTQSNLALSYAQAGYLVNNQQFGTWNGTATSAGLVTQYGKTPNTARAVNIYRTDWQGKQLLYPTPRTNFLGYSGQIGTVSWYYEYTSGTLNSTTAPDGTTTATLLTDTTAAANHGVQQSVTLPAGLITESVYFKAGSLAYCSLQFIIGSGGAYVYFDLSGSGSISQAPAAYGVFSLLGSSAEIVALSGGWFRCSFTVENPSSGSVEFFPQCQNAGTGPGYYTGTGTGTIYVWGGQGEFSSAPTGYIPTPTSSPVTITDYTLTGTTVNLAQAPASTATTNATFYAT